MASPRFPFCRPAACAQVCPTESAVVGRRAELALIAAREIMAQVGNPDLGHFALPNE